MTTTNRVARPAPSRPAPSRAAAVPPAPTARRVQTAPLTRPAPGPTIPKAVSDAAVKQENAAAKAAIPKDRADNGVAQPATRRRAPVLAPVAQPETAADEFDDGAAEPAVEAAQETNGTGLEEFDDAPPAVQDEFSEAELAESQLPAEPLEAELDPAPIARQAPSRPGPRGRQPAPQNPPAAPRQPAPQHAISTKAPTPPARKIEPVQAPATAKRKPELAAASQTAVAAHVGARRAEATTIKGDLLIPKILLCQASSQIVKDRKAFPGQIVKSPSGTIIGGIHELNAPAEGVELILLSLSQSWTVVEAQDNVFRRSEARTPANDTLPWEFQDEDGTPCKRLKTVDTVCLLTNDVINNQGGAVETDEDGVPLNLDDAVLLPHAFSFKSTGFQAGKFISTVFAKIQAGQKDFPNMLPYHFSVDITVNLDSDGEHDYYVLEAYNTHKTDKEHLSAAKTAYEMVKNSNVRIQDEADAESEVSENMVARPSGVGKAPRGQY